MSRGAAAGRALPAGTVRRTVTAAASLYLAFLITWGLNYRRVPLAEKLEFDAGSVSAAAARTLATTSRRGGQPAVSVGRPRRRARQWIRRSPVHSISRTSGAGRQSGARPARPKHSILDPYFKRAAVDGMTDPYFLETLVVSDLLPFERSFVVAHEWSHLGRIRRRRRSEFRRMADMHPRIPSRAVQRVAVFLIVRRSGR